MEQLNVTVYKTDTHIVITGQPDKDVTHNCDAMGCGQEHVLYRFPLPSSYTTVPVESELAGMFLEEAVREGKRIEIPSLGIVLNDI